MENFEISTTKEDLPKLQQKLRINAFQGMFKYPDGSHSVVYKNTPPNTNDNMISYDGKLLKITEIISTRKHRGVFKNEEDRLNISIVKSQPIIFTLTT